METETRKATHNQIVSDRLSASAVDLLDQLAAIDKETELLPDEITVADYAARIGIKRGAAENRLESLVVDGFLTKRIAVDNGRKVRAYRKLE